MVGASIICPNASNIWPAESQTAKARTLRVIGDRFTAMKFYAEEKKIVDPYLELGKPVKRLSEKALPVPDEIGISVWSICADD